MLIVLSDFDMTVYNPDSRILDLIKTLAGSEGLFVWQPPGNEKVEIERK